MLTEQKGNGLITIIVPTMNEAGNIETLLKRIGDALLGYHFDVLFVDDSKDNTPDIILHVGSLQSFPVTLIARPPSDRNGLSGAVVEGIVKAKGEWVCVMDGDLQHPPELLPQMIQAAKKTGADMIVGSRRANLLGPMGLSLFRTLISQALTIMARALFPRSLKDVSDPLTGLFMVRRDMVKIERLRPNGFKILLEILIRCPHMRISEVKFDFAERVAEDSKADFREGMRFFRHLLHLRTTAHQRPIFRYLLVTGAALLINLFVIIQMINSFGDTFLISTLAVIVATIAADAWSYWANRWFVIPDEELGGADFGKVFWLNLGLLMLIHLPLFGFFHWGWEMTVFTSAMLSIGLAGFCRYMISDQWIWTKGLLTVKRPTFYYDIHQLLLLESPVQLPDLATFQIDEPTRPPDIQIRIDRHGTPRRIHDCISYDDRLGRIGFGLTVMPADNFVEAVISPMIARSNHVLYINVVEPLVRWMLLNQQVALIRGGCYVLDGACHLVSAPSRDATAEKTLSIMEKSGERFEYLSHDLVLLRPDGTVYAYPNTVVQQKLLETGLVRRIGALARRVQLPAATFGAWVQILWPPKQLTIQQRVAVPKIRMQARLSQVSIFNQEGHIVRSDDVVSQWQSNTFDRFGFPLFTDLVKQFSPVEEDFIERERKILSSVLKKEPIPL